MKIKLLVGVLIWGCGFGNTVFAQKENYVWYFGNHAGLDFNSGSPIALTNSSMFAFEGCSSISDSNGNLLFYTDGITVYNKNHNQMPNGDSLAGGWSSTQAALIVLKPGSSTIYYIFTVQCTNDTTKNFSCSMVDMALDGNNGDVTMKNNFLATPVTEKLAAVKHTNNNDIWIMVHGLNNDSFYSYLLTSGGLSASPVISNVGQVITDSAFDAIGQMKFSSDGTKVAFAATTNNYVDLFDFNSSTGVVSNEIYLTLPGQWDGAYGLEFSMSGTYLYSSLETQTKIYQWDVTSNSAAIINASRQLVGSSPNFALGALQMGPDGKIYVAKPYPFSVGLINYPELSGNLCIYIDNAISLNGNQCMFGLPTFISSYFLPTGIITTNPQQNQLTIYPNPATDKIYISFPAIASENITVKIYSVTGENLFQSSETLEKVNATTIDVTGLLNGIYFLSIQTGREVVTRKIVVNH